MCPWFLIHSDIGFQCSFPKQKKTPQICQRSLSKICTLHFVSHTNSFLSTKPFSFAELISCSIFQISKLQNQDLYLISKYSVLPHIPIDFFLFHDIELIDSPKLQTIYQVRLQVAGNNWLILGVNRLVFEEVVGSWLAQPRFLPIHLYRHSGLLSHMRLRAREHYTASTLIGGKGGAGPSLFHTTLEGPTEYARWM